jgi:hypothetical protein
MVFATQTTRPKKAKTGLKAEIKTQNKIVKRFYETSESLPSESK